MSKDRIMDQARRQVPLLLRLLASGFMVVAPALILLACNAEGEGTPVDQTEGGNAPEESEEEGNADDNTDDNDDNGADEEPDNGDNDDPGEPDECDQDGDCETGQSASCGAGERFQPLVNDHAELGLRVRVRAGTSGGRCRHCSVRDRDAAIENNLLSSARMITPAGTSSSVYLTVSMPHTGSGMAFAGFMVSASEDLALSGIIDRLDLSVVRNRATVSRMDSSDGGFHVFETGDGSRYMVMMETEEGFDSVRIRLKGDSGRDNTLHVHAACVDRYGW